jgi:hypothetical protein
MFGLRALGNAIATLTANVLRLSATVKDINDQLRQRAALDGPDEPLALTMPAEASSVAQGEPAATNDSTTGPMPTVGRNGRRRTSTVEA